MQRSKWALRDQYRLFCSHPAAPKVPEPPSAATIWDRIKRHKVVEWTVAHIAFGYASLHGAEMLRDAFEWSPAVPRLTFFALALGLPIAITLAWYHGHRAQHRVSRAELATLVALLLLAWSALWFLARTGRAHVAAGVVAESIPFAKPLGDKSIAVLPFVDMSEKRDQEYFSDGLSEELIDLLTQIHDLQVIARTSSFFFKGKQTTIPDIAKMLGAANPLEGSVRRAGNTIRVTAQLIHADNGVHLWSNSYDRDLSDIFKVQDEIATAVVGALKAKLAPSRQPEDAERSENPEAYDQYLLGKQLNHRGKLEDYRRAVAADLKALALDPGYAAAYAVLSLNESHAATYINDAAGFGRARAAAERAISLAPQLAAGYRARAVARLFTLDFPGAQADEEKALTIASGDSRVQNDYGYVMATFGRLPDVIAAMNKAIALDPLNSDAWGNLGSYLTAQRDFPAARRALDEHALSAILLSCHQCLERHVGARRAVYEMALSANKRHSVPRSARHKAVIPFLGLNCDQFDLDSRCVSAPNTSASATKTPPITQRWLNQSVSIRARCGSNREYAIETASPVANRTIDC
jgi:TolB-like protein/Flp pilus assembly protein TadD